MNRKFHPLTRLNGATDKPYLNDTGKGGDTPESPDYEAAAIATAKGNADAARIAAKANRVSQYTPYGNLVYTQGTGDPTFNQSAYDQSYAQYLKQQDQYTKQQSRQSQGYYNPGGIGDGLMSRGGSGGVAPTAPNINDFYTIGDQDRWRADVTLAPEQQALLDKQNEISLGLGDSMSKALGYTNEQISQPFDTSQLPSVITPDVAGQEQIVQAMMDRQQPIFDRQRQQQENDLITRGFNRGGQAWNTSQDDLNRGENDARLAAIMAGGQEQSRLFGLGTTARQQALQEQAFLRNEPLNTLNSLRTGAQVTNPTFVNTPQQQTTAGPDLLGAANAEYSGQLNSYNAQQASGSNGLGGLFQLGGMALSAGSGQPWWMAA